MRFVRMCYGDCERCVIAHRCGARQRALVPTVLLHCHMRREELERKQRTACPVHMSASLPTADLLASTSLSRALTVSVVSSDQFAQRRAEIRNVKVRFPVVTASLTLGTQCSVASMVF